MHILNLKNWDVTVIYWKQLRGVYSTSLAGEPLVDYVDELYILESSWMWLCFLLICLTSKVARAMHVLIHKI